MDLYALKEQLKKHEGLKLKAYLCSAETTTIGYGRNLEINGISEDEADIMLDNDIEKVIKDLVQIFPNWYHYSVKRQNALADMRFQLGYSGFRSFNKMIEAVKKCEWDRVSYEAATSLWRRQTPERAEVIIGMFK